MKTKKKPVLPKKKGYAAGGDIYSLQQLQQQGVTNYVNNSDYGTFNSPFKSQKEQNQGVLSSAATGMQMGSVAGPYGAVIGAVVGAGVGLGKMQGENVDRRNYVASASPGNYAKGGKINCYQGGPLQTAPVTTYNVPQTPAVYNIPYTAPIVSQTPVDPMRALQLGTTGTPLPVANARLPYESGSSKSKAKDRFREHATGGYLDDQQLSNSSFQVKGNPNVTDGNSYPELNANLDHNEVVKDNNFVFSNKLKMPNGKSFAEAARKLEISTGKSEKVLRSNPDDMFARATIAHNENRSNILAREQEALATAKGLREPTRNFAVGGSLDGPGDRILLGRSPNNSGEEVFFDKATKQFLTRDNYGNFKATNDANIISMYRNNREVVPYLVGGAEQLAIEKRAGFFPQDQADLAEQYAKVGKTTAGNNSMLTTTSDTPNMRVATVPPTTDPAQLGAFPYPTTTPPSAPFPTIPTGKSGGKKLPTSNIPSKPTAPFNTNAAEYDRAMYEEMLAAGNAGDIRPSDKPPAYVGSIAPKRGLPDMSSALNYGKPSADGTVDGTVDGTGYNGLGQDFTLGDGLQLLEVGSKFAQNIGGPEIDSPYYDNTTITKENYDPSNALYQSQRNTQLAKNSLQNSSINQNRSFLNNLQVNKLNQDSDILAKYNQMNQSAQTQYEARTSDQRRYNVGQTVYTNDINARNRGAYKNAVDTAFTSLGNYGEALNSKQQGYDALNILRTSYPEVYARVMAEKQTKKKQNGR